MGESPGIPIDWHAVKAAYLECRSHKLAAARFGLSPNTVKTRARREGWARDSEFQTSPAELEFSKEEEREDRNNKHEGPSLLDVEVTTYPNAMSPDCPAVDTLASVLESIRTGEFRTQIDNLRRILQRDGKAAYDRAKTKLPAFCVSGTTSDRKRLLIHSNLLQIDFDGLGGALAEARRKVVSDPHAAAAFTSPSGDGLKVFLHIDGLRHSESVVAATDYFWKTHRLKHDPQVKEPTRLCFVSHDPDIFLNPSATVLPLPESSAASKESKSGNAWRSAFRGDLHTLDLAAAFREAGLLGDCLDPDEGKWAVKCPWAHLHGDGGRDHRQNNSSTVIFTGGDFPAFKCLHAHCATRSIEHVCTRLEADSPGIIDRHCAKLRSAFAGESLEKAGLPCPWGEPLETAAEQLVERNGSPFYHTNKKDGSREVIDFNSHYWAARFAFENLVIFEPLKNQFFTYSPDSGIWNWQTDAAIRAHLAAWMLGYARRLNQPLLETGRKGERLSQMLTIMRAACERRSPFRKSEKIVHLRNCMVHLEPNPPEIHKFSPHYFSLAQCQVPYDPEADCPRFLHELVYPSMGEEDAALLQLVGGLYITGRNNWHKMLIMTGIGGAGKGTIGRIFGHIIGNQNLKQLRTKLLGDRFELDDLDQVSLFVGSDVPYDFLSCEGAKVIKALTGGDPLTLEFKGGRKLNITGDHNVLITSNDRLRINLDGDEGAWHRRLLIIPFLSKPPRRTPDLDRILMRAEGSGILNWFLLGAAQLARFEREGIDWPLTREQQKRIDDMLAESDSLRSFVGQGVIRQSDASVTVDEILGAYENYCAELGWLALSKAQVERGLGPLMMELHRAAKRNDIPRGTSQKRGFMGVRLFEPCEGSNEPRVEPSGGSNELSGGSNGGSKKGLVNPEGSSSGVHEKSADSTAIPVSDDDAEPSKEEETSEPSQSAAIYKLLVTNALPFLKQGGGLIARLNIEALEGRFLPPSHRAAIPNSPAPPLSKIPNKTNPSDGSDGILTIRASKTNLVGSQRVHECDASKPSKNGKKASEPSEPPPPVKLATPVDFPEIAAAIRDKASVALDIETFGRAKNDALNPWRGDIRLLSLRVPGSDPWLIDLQSTGYDLGELGAALEAVEVIAHNAKFDLLWLGVKCRVWPKRVFCTLTAARLLSAGTKPGNNLDQCLERYLGVQPGDDHARSDWGGMFLTDDQLAYAARDVAHLHDLAAKQDLILGGDELEAVRDLEFALIPVVVAMEAAGMPVDAELLRSIRDRGKSTARSLADDIRSALSLPMLNVASPDQVREALKGAGIDLPNTNEETLKASDDGNLIPKLLAYRTAEKSAQQAESLLECIEADGRIHGRFEPTGTDTGRFASKSPNLQNIGRGELRACFTAPEGRRLVVADYSQIELRAAAAIAGEQKMIDAYKRGEDLHKLTASTVLGKPLEAITKQDRQLSKAVNFGLLYGQSAKGLVRYAATSYGVALPEDDALEIRRAFFRTYGSLRQWHGESHVKAEKGVSEVRTILGRRRLIPDSADEWQRFTALVNTPVQGSCADGMKRALVILSTRLPQSANILSTVHDEVIVECAEADAPSVLESTKAAMVEAMAAIIPQVPVEVEGGVCGNWSEK
jgi:P4 family phage/plasmid primase-like protien